MLSKKLFQDKLRLIWSAIDSNQAEITSLKDEVLGFRPFRRSLREENDELKRNLYALLNYLDVEIVDVKSHKKVQKKDE